MVEFFFGGGAVEILLANNCLVAQQIPEYPGASSSIDLWRM
jgi:hypothetical protein